MRRPPYNEIFSEETLDSLFPPERTERFFEALFGDAEEGAYTIRLRFLSADENDNQLHFEFQLLQKPGQCLACNLTHGLPDVFARHPAINVRQTAHDLVALLGNNATCASWTLGSTRQNASDLHTIPLTITLS